MHHKTFSMEFCEENYNKRDFFQEATTLFYILKILLQLNCNIIAINWNYYN